MSYSRRPGTGALWRVRAKWLNPPFREWDPRACRIGIESMALAHPPPLVGEEAKRSDPREQKALAEH